MLSVFSVVAVALLAGVQHVAAVCNPGQLAVGHVTFTNPDGFAGFEMIQDCGMISVTPTTLDPDQYCNGPYSAGAAVLCGQDGFPNLAVDTLGNTFQCSETSDTSCNSETPSEKIEVLVCCDMLPPE